MVTPLPGRSRLSLNDSRSILRRASRLVNHLDRSSTTVQADGGDKVYYLATSASLAIVITRTTDQVSASLALRHRPSTQTDGEVRSWDGVDLGQSVSKDAPLVVESLTSTRSYS